MAFVWRFRNNETLKKIKAAEQVQQKPDGKIGMHQRDQNAPVKNEIFVKAIFGKNFE